jgi:thiol-disulfide isomerase/thioredoxin
LQSGEKILYGKIDREQLFVYFPEWQEEYNSYNPDPAILQQLATRNLDIAVEIFFGTWCADSRREVPRFYKILDSMRFISADQVELWAVDRQKRLNNNLAQDKNIQFVATFIFSRDGKEIDRIIEAPYETLEKDILKILNDI